jgi:ABC-2 type transport system ATP-binding protein
MDLGRFGGHLTRSLSGGQHQKLAVVLAMLHQPELLVLDEPTTGVDPVSRAEVWRLLARAAAEGTAVVVATGYLDEGERAHRVHLLSAGRMLLSGSPAQLVSQVDGEIRLVDVPPRPERAWRSGTAWRAWFAPGEPVLGEPVRVTLEDAAIVSMVRAREAAA